MAGQGRPTIRSCAWLLWALLPWLPGGAVQTACAEDASNWLRGDAQLADVTFVDAGNGWAVGDRGAIWHTTDGGERWQLQESGVDCRLTSVQFLDARTGWAAGGRTQPYTQVSQGVLLHTRDGGQHWSHDRRLLLPALTSVKFSDKLHGWALGRSSDLFTSGVFSTEDGGRSWTSLPAGNEATWTTGDFADPLSGALAGPRGALATVRRRGVEPSKTAEVSLRAWRRLTLFGPAQAWAVGDGAWVLRSDDLGRSWQTPAGDLPAGVRDHFDFHAVAAVGDRCWIGGAPGSKVFHTPDGGRTWLAQATGQSLPIRAVTFQDEQRGWAVGDLGLILATRDGGRTWRRQRSGGTRAAVLGCFSTPNAIPVELFARLSADEGYLGVAEILNRQDLDVPLESADVAARTHEALIRAGASGGELAWRFPLRPAGLNLAADRLLDGWNRANDGQGLERLEGHIVQKIRQWRPAIIVLSAADTSADTAQQLVNQIVLQAVEHAADATQHSEQITVAGLEPWKVQKVYAALPPGEHGSTNITTSHVSTRWGRSLADLAAPARGLLAGAASSAPIVGFRLLVDHVPQDQGKRDFFSGIALSPGGEARRTLPEVVGQDMDELRRAAHSRRNLQAILARSDDNDPQADARWLGEIGELTRKLDANSGAELLFQLGDRYYRSGRWELAAESFELLATRYPEHPLAGASLVWLVQYYSSSEAQWRVRRGQGRVARQIVTMPTPRLDLAPKEIARKESGDVKPPSAVQQASAQSVALREEQRSTLPDLAGNDSWGSRSANFGKQLEQLQPTLFAEPQVRFPLAAAQRSQGFPRQAERYYLGLRRTRRHDAWWASAESEQWLMEPRGVAPKSVWTCQRTAARPRLDGQLDDPAWRQAAPIELHSSHRDDGEWPAVALAAFDAEFLYLAVSCRRAPGIKYESGSGPRPRDADLSQQDRVDVLIDLDRDGATSYRLSIDHRGWTSDALWRDVTWNPNWFVAAQTTDDTWTAEAAIPLAELTGEPPGAKSVWAVGAQRVVPGVGFQSWTTPASLEGQAEGFGLLLFE